MPFPNKSTQFQKGTDSRRNLSGRPKGARNLSTVLMELIKQHFWHDISIPKSFVREYCQDRKTIKRKDVFRCVKKYLESQGQEVKYW